MTAVSLDLRAETNLLLVGGATENEAVRIGNASGNVTISKGGANGFNSGVVSSTTGSLTMTIQNLHMTGVTVNGAALTSLVFAGVESGYITATITLKNSEFISCKLDKNLEHASGYLFGSPWNGTIGFNGLQHSAEGLLHRCPRHLRRRSQQKRQLYAPHSGQPGKLLRRR